MDFGSVIGILFSLASTGHPIMALAVVVDIARRPVKNKVAWVVAVIFLPLLGVGLYLVFGRNRVEIPIDTGSSLVQPGEGPSNSAAMSLASQPTTMNSPVVKTILGVIGGLLIVGGAIVVGFAVLIMISLAQCKLSGSSKCY